MSQVLKRQFRSKTDKLAGRTSDYDVRKQLDSYLNWILKVRTPEEVIVRLSEMYRKDLKNFHATDLEARKEFLEKLRLFYAKQLQLVNKELKRTKKHLGINEAEFQW